MKLLVEYYHLIDDGGINVDFYMDEYNFVKIETSTMYYGHPHITSSLNGQLDENVIREIGLHYLKMADKMAEHKLNNPIKD